MYVVLYTISITLLAKLCNHTHTKARNGMADICRHGTTRAKVFDIISGKEAQKANYKCLDMQHCVVCSQEMKVIIVQGY